MVLWWFSNIKRGKTHGFMMMSEELKLSLFAQNRLILEAKVGDYAL